MEHKKTTAVEYLIDNLHLMNSDKWSDVIEEAKTLEKEQIVHAFIVAENHQWDGTRHAIHYYQQTYKK